MRGRIIAFVHQIKRAPPPPVKGKYRFTWKCTYESKVIFNGWKWGSVCPTPNKWIRCFCLVQERRTAHRTSHRPHPLDLAEPLEGDPSAFTAGFSNLHNIAVSAVKTHTTIQHVSGNRCRRKGGRSSHWRPGKCPCAAQGKWNDFLKKIVREG